MKLFSKLIIAASLLLVSVFSNAQELEFMKWEQPEKTGIQSIDDLMVSVSGFHATTMSTVNIPVYSVKYVTSDGITNAFIMDENGNVKGKLETFNQFMSVSLASASAVADGTLIVADIALAILSVPEIISNPLAIPKMIRNLNYASRVVKADIKILKALSKSLKAQRTAVKALKNAGTDATALENAKVMLEDANMHVTEEVVDDAQLQELLAQQALLDEGLEEMEEISDEDL